MQLRVKKIPWYTSWIGLIGQKSQAICFTTRFGIHTFGMQYPIDVVILDGNNVVRKIKENLQPNRFFFWNPKYNVVLELPQEEIKKRKIKTGTELKVEKVL